MKKQLNETTLGSVFGAAGDPHGGIFIGPLRGASKKVMHRRLLYPTYKNSTGKNSLVHNALSENYIFNTEGKEITGKDVERLCELGITNKLMYKGGKFMHVEPKCASFPYCDQGAPDKPIRLISGTKEGMCEGCGTYCSVIAEQSGKSLEYVAEGFRNYTLKKLSEMSILNEQKISNFLSSIEKSVQPRVFNTIKEFLNKDKIDPDNTFDDLLKEVDHLMRKSGAQDLSESIENLDNKTKQNIKEMKVESKVKCTKKEMMESLLESEVGKCMREQLQNEGFLPNDEELNEGLTLESSMKTMMEDAELVDEMFQSVTEAKCDCSEGIKKYVKENFDWQKEDSDDEEEIEDEEPEEDKSDDVEMDEPEIEVGDEEEVVEPEVADDEIVVEPEIELGDQEEVDGSDDTFQGLIDTLVALQTKYASDEEGSNVLDSLNDMLNSAKSLKDQEQETGTNIIGEPADDIEIDAEEPEVAGDLDIELDGEEEIDVNDTLAEADTPKPKQVKRKDPESYPDDLEVDDVVGNDYGAKLVKKMKRFRWEWDQAIRFQSYTDYFKFPASVHYNKVFLATNDAQELEASINDLKSDMLTYYSPIEGESHIAFLSRIVDLHNDLHGFNAAFVDMMTPNKRGYFKKMLRLEKEKVKANNSPEAQKKIAQDHDEEYTDEEGPKEYDADNKLIAKRDKLPYKFHYDDLEGILSDLFQKYKAILKSGALAAGEDGEEDDEAAEDIRLDQVDNYGNMDDFADDGDDVEPTADQLTAKASNVVGKNKKFSFDDDLDLDDESEDELDLNEEKMPTIAPGIMADNKASAKENDIQAKDAIASQKTVSQKVDGMKNQKFNASVEQKAIEAKGNKSNNLDLDYDTELTPERKKQILDQAKGLAPKDHVNVDHDSKGGETLIKAAQARAPETAMDYSSIPDGVTIKQEDKYKTTTAVNEDLARMRNLIMFDATKLKDKKSRDKVDEVKYLTEKIQKKKFL